MLVLRGGSIPLSGRSWPDTPQEALARVIFLVILAAVVVPAVCWVWWWFNTNRPTACRRRLEKESADFRARWPADQLGRAPYGELDKEAQRCWLLVLLLEERKYDITGTEVFSRDIDAVRHWISMVVTALNAAAARDRQDFIARDFG
ncbi:hypothetical protein [Mycobacterium sp. DL440]|uniref:hypothetical protein n=1 Tax=Mycobacterium sp. DL440 TaxID=2675523 RepID=UPI00141F5C7F|nr:hypothetical protein [Mycobacterium sp. DL440]